MSPSYAELHCLSNFTFLRGASHPQELVERAAQLGYGALALTDECSLAGVVRAHVVARALQLKLIIGSEIQLADGPKLVLLAINAAGYGNLSELITRARRAANKGNYHLTRADLVEQGVANCLALLIPDAATEVGDVLWLANLFPQGTWLAVELTRGPNDAVYLQHLQALGAAAQVPLVATGDVHMHTRARHALQDALSAIRLGKPVAELGLALHPNGERHLRAIGRLAHIYPPELLAQTLIIAQRCTFSLAELRYEYPEEIVMPGETPTSYLRKLSDAGLATRYPQGAPEDVCLQLEKELNLIAELNYEAYFLTVYDIVKFARSQNILCQGRGSAANSVVCFCLGITEVDPARMQMLFERFISKERNEPPDIDVDFEHQRREEVMQYIFAKYGRERAAIVGAVHTYRPKGALRDLGKALGFSLDQADSLAGAMAWWDGREIHPARLREAGFDPTNIKVQRLIALAHELLGFPRHLSQHSGGFVIDRRRLSRLVPIENAAMPKRTVIQWDKDDLDALGLMKVDVLSLGMLSAIRWSLDLMNRYYGQQWRMADIPAEDAATYTMIQHADTIGVFQIESRAQMSMLPRLKPRCYYDLVIEVAIVRPGPIQGGMVHPYLRRREGLEPVTYPSVAVKAVLERTLGVSIFQEQVMQLAMVAAGFTPGEADQLRRAMAAWKRKGGLEPFRDKLIAGMLTRGYKSEFAEAIFQQILGFGEYGFPESHAASFALLAYVSAWFKCHEPAAFACALLNSQPLGFYSNAEIVHDVKRHGVEVLAADVTLSDWHCSLEGEGKTPPRLRLGLLMIKGLNEAAGQAIVTARAQQPFRDIADLSQRAALDKRALNALAAADALVNISGHRRAALWQTLGMESPMPLLPSLNATPLGDIQPSLFSPSEGENIVADYAHLGLSLRRHPLALLRPRLRQMRLASSAEIKTARHGQLMRAAGLVTCRQRPSTSSGVTFVTLEDEDGYINVVIWRDLAERQRGVLLGARLLAVYGSVERQGGVIHLIAGRLVDHSRLLGDLQIHSHDFH
jgi:error-prone DNA polymerase